jgi:hypothetical protein
LSDEGPFLFFGELALLRYDHITNETLLTFFPGGRKGSPMAYYLKAPLGPDGIVVTRGKIEKVEGRASATEVVYGDADFLQRRAFEQWPDLDWQIEKIGDKKYVVVAKAAR